MPVFAQPQEGSAQDQRITSLYQLLENLQIPGNIKEKMKAWLDGAQILLNNSFNVQNLNEKEILLRRANLLVSLAWQVGLAEAGRIADFGDFLTKWTARAIYLGDMIYSTTTSSLSDIDGWERRSISLGNLAANFLLLKDAYLGFPLQNEESKNQRMEFGALLNGANSNGLLFKSLDGIDNGNYELPSSLMEMALSVGNACMQLGIFDGMGGGNWQGRNDLESSIKKFMNNANQNTMIDLANAQFNGGDSILQLLEYNENMYFGLSRALPVLSGLRSQLEELKQKAGASGNAFAFSSLLVQWSSKAQIIKNCQDQFLSFQRMRDITCPEMDGICSRMNIQATSKPAVDSFNESIALVKRAGSAAASGEIAQAQSLLSQSRMKAQEGVDKLNSMQKEVNRKVQDGRRGALASVHELLEHVVQYAGNGYQDWIKELRNAYSDLQKAMENGSVESIGGSMNKFYGFYNGFLKSLKSEEYYDFCTRFGTEGEKASAGRALLRQLYDTICNARAANLSQKEVDAIDKLLDGILWLIENGNELMLRNALASKSTLYWACAVVAEGRNTGVNDSEITNIRNYVAKEFRGQGVGDTYADFAIEFASALTFLKRGKMEINDSLVQTRLNTIDSMEQSEVLEAWINEETVSRVSIAVAVATGGLLALPSIASSLPAAAIAAMDGLHAAANTVLLAQAAQGMGVGFAEQGFMYVSTSQFYGNLAMLAMFFPVSKLGGMTGEILEGTKGASQVYMMASMGYGAVMSAREIASGNRNIEEWGQLGENLGFIFLTLLHVYEAKQGARAQAGERTRTEGMGRMEAARTLAGELEAARETTPVDPLVRMPEAPKPPELAGREIPEAPKFEARIPELLEGRLGAYGRGEMFQPASVRELQPLFDGDAQIVRANAGDYFSRLYHLAASAENLQTRTAIITEMRDVFTLMRQKDPNLNLTEADWAKVQQSIAGFDSSPTQVHAVFAFNEGEEALRALKGKERGRVLVIGCGDGKSVEFFRGQGFDVVGWDSDPAFEVLARISGREGILGGDLRSALEQFKTNGPADLIYVSERATQSRNVDARALSSAAGGIVSREGFVVFEKPLSQIPNAEGFFSANGFEVQGTQERVMLRTRGEASLSALVPQAGEGITSPTVPIPPEAERAQPPAPTTPIATPPVDLLNPEYYSQKRVPEITPSDAPVPGSAETIRRTMETNLSLLGFSEEGAAKFSGRFVRALDSLGFKVEEDNGRISQAVERALMLLKGENSEVVFVTREGETRMPQGYEEARMAVELVEGEGGQKMRRLYVNVPYYEGFIDGNMMNGEGMFLLLHDVVHEAVHSALIEVGTLNRTPILREGLAEALTQRYFAESQLRMDFIEYPEETRLAISLIERYRAETGEFPFTMKALADFRARLVEWVGEEDANRLFPRESVQEELPIAAVGGRRGLFGRLSDFAERLSVGEEELQKRTDELFIQRSQDPFQVPKKSIRENGKEYWASGKALLGIINAHCEKLFVLLNEVREGARTDVTESQIRRAIECHVEEIIKLRESGKIDNNVCEGNVRSVCNRFNERYDNLITERDIVLLLNPSYPLFTSDIYASQIRTRNILERTPEGRAIADRLRSEGGKVLVIGCGEGLEVEALREMGIDAYGWDPNYSRGVLAKIGGRDYIFSCTYEEAKGRWGGKADVVLSMAVCDEIGYELTLEETNAFLKKGGYAIHQLMYPGVTTDQEKHYLEAGGFKVVADFGTEKIIERASDSSSREPSLPPASGGSPRSAATPEGAGAQPSADQPVGTPRTTLDRSAVDSVPWVEPEVRTVDPVFTAQSVERVEQKLASREVLTVADLNTLEGVMGRFLDGTQDPQRNQYFRALDAAYFSNNEAAMLSLGRAIARRMPNFSEFLSTENNPALKLEVMAILQIENTNPGMTRALYYEYGICVFSRYESEILETLYRRIGETNDERPVVVYVNPISDNGAFAQSKYGTVTDNIRGLVGGANCVIIEAGNTEELVARLNRIAEKRGKISVLVFNAHGTPTSAELSLNTGRQGMLTYYGLLREMAAQRRATGMIQNPFVEIPVIIADSCSTGSKIAQDVSLATKAMIIAPIDISDGVEIRLDQGALAVSFGATEAVVFLKGEQVMRIGLDATGERSRAVKFEIPGREESAQSSSTPAPPTLMEDSPIVIRVPGSPRNVGRSGESTGEAPESSRSEGRSLEGFDGLIADAIGDRETIALLNENITRADRLLDSRLMVVEDREGISGALEEAFNGNPEMASEFFKTTRPLHAESAQGGCLFERMINGNTRSDGTFDAEGLVADINAFNQFEVDANGVGFRGDYPASGEMLVEYRRHMRNFNPSPDGRRLSPEEAGRAVAEHMRDFFGMNEGQTAREDRVRFFDEWRNSPELQTFNKAFYNQQYDGGYDAFRKALDVVDPTSIVVPQGGGITGEQVLEAMKSSINGLTNSNESGDMDRMIDFYCKDGRIMDAKGIEAIASSAGNLVRGMMDGHGGNLNGSFVPDIQNSIVRAQGRLFMVHSISISSGNIFETLDGLRNTTDFQILRAEFPQEYNKLLYNVMTLEMEANEAIREAREFLEPWQRIGGMG